MTTGLADDIAFILRVKLERVEPRIVVDKRTLSVAMLDENNLMLSFKYYIKDLHVWDKLETTLKMNR
jgi:hypothetical protein